MPPGTAGDRSVASRVLIDAHAHFWDAYDLDRFLDAASRNFGLAEREVGSEIRPSRLLLLMETSNEGLVHRRRDAENTRGGSWRLEPTDEAGSIRARPAEPSDEPPLLLVEGRQVVTAEGLELLAAPCLGDLPAGLPISETIAAAREVSAIPILPWGFGKWWGARGRVVAALLEAHRPHQLLLADNGGRPNFGWKPRLLTLAAQRGFRVLGGSDPLPIADDAKRVGSFGSLLRGQIEEERPAAGVRRLLGSLAVQPRGFGIGMSLGSFFSTQLRLRVSRRSS